MFVDFKWCGGGEYWQFCQIWVVLNIVFDVGFLCYVDYLYCWVVLYQCQIVVYVVGGFVDWFVDEFVSGVMIGFQYCYQFVIFGCQ